MFDNKQSLINMCRRVMTLGTLSLLFAMTSCGSDDDGGGVTPPIDPGIDVTALKQTAVLDFSDPSELNLVGVTPVENGLGTGYSFQASAAEPTCGVESSYIGAPDLGAIWANGITVAAWVNFSENRYFERIIDFGKTLEGVENIGENGAMNVTLARLEDTNDLALTSWISDDGALNKSTGRLIAVDAITNGTTQLYVGTISPTGVMTISVNGQVIATKNNGHPVVNEARTSNFIGRSNWCFLDQDFKGTMSALWVFNKVLTEEEITALVEDGEANL